MTSSTTGLPEERLRAVNAAPVRRAGEFVLYWMTAARRLEWSFALERAIEHARALERPLLVLEPLRCGYDHASPRLHRFVLDGMRANASFAGRRTAVHYLPYVEPEPGAGKGLLSALSKRACVVLTDDYPAFFLPRMLAVAGRMLAVRLEAVDGNGLLPLAAAGRAFTTAHSLRAFLQRELPPHLERMPAPDPLRGLRLPDLADLPREVRRLWPEAEGVVLAGDEEALAALPLDHSVPPVDTRGGAEVGARVVERFVGERLERYADDRNQPGEQATSGLSPYLHFGHVSSHQVLAAVAAREGWSPDDVSAPLGGAREGWWGMSASAEAFLDQIVTWRELGQLACRNSELPQDSYDSLPEWSRRTLEEHASDPREHVYSYEELEQARTHDELWNAAQRQLVREGAIHNYLRMLWGKRVLEWTAHPREAFDTLVRLNDRWALDGRDPNSYSAIGWVFGRFDRAWGPERQVYGKVRYMSSANTARKLRLGSYLERYGQPLLFPPG